MVFAIIHLPLILHPYIIMPALKMPRRYLSNDNKDDDGVTSNEKRMFLTNSMDPMFKGNMFKRNVRKNDQKTIFDDLFYCPEEDVLPMMELAMSLGLTKVHSFPSY